MAWDHVAAPREQSVGMPAHEICRYFRERIGRQGESSVDLADKVCP